MDDTEVAGALQLVRWNTLTCAQTLVSRLKSENVKLPEGWTKEMEAKILNTDRLTPEIAQIIVTLTKFDSVKFIIKEHGDEMEFAPGAEGARFFFEHVTKYVDDKYKPDIEDLMRARQKTTGIKQYNLTCNGADFVLLDVGGQESERKKWVSVFEEVTMVIFLVAVNEYDMYLEENGAKNRMVDSLQLWLNLTRCSFLRDKPFVLFLNKSDLLQKKIDKNPVSNFFDGYEDFVAKQSQKNTAYDNSWLFFKEQFLSKYEGTKKVTVHLTSALDTKACKKIWMTLVEELRTISLGKSGLV